MPRKDTYHDLVIRALLKAGWQIVDEQSPFSIEQRTLFIDIEAQMEGETRLVFVEVKGFNNVS
jgi:Holliday junction resolvase-like predicted endonuclease